MFQEPDFNFYLPFFSDSFEKVEKAKRDKRRKRKHSDEEGGKSVLLVTSLCPFDWVDVLRHFDPMHANAILHCFLMFLLLIV